MSLFRWARAPLRCSGIVLVIGALGSFGACRPVAGGDELVAVEKTLAALGEVPLDAPQDLPFAADRESSLPVTLPPGCVALVVRAAASSPFPTNAKIVAASGEVLVRSVAPSFVHVLRSCSEQARSGRIVLQAPEGAGQARTRLWSDGRAVDRPVMDQTAGRGTCGSPLPMVAGLQSGTTRNAFSAVAVSCADGTGPERVHELVLREARRIRLDLSAQFDASLAIRRSCEDPRSEIACNDDSAGVDFAFSRGQGSTSRGASLATVLPAGRYFVIVDGADGETGEYALSYTSERVADFAQRCRAAERFGASGDAVGDWSDGLASATAPCGGNAHGPELLRALPLDAPSRVRISVDADGPFTPVVHVRSRCEDAATSEMCGLPTLGRTAIAAGILPAGVHTVFLDAEEVEASGNVRAFVETSPAAGIGTLADTCDDAERLPITGREIHAESFADTFTARDDDAISCASASGPEVFRSFTLSERSRVEIAKNSDEGSHVFAIRRGDCVHPVEVACGMTVDTVLPAGNYTIVAEANGPSGIGRVDFQVATYPMQPREKACASAAVLPQNGKVTGSTTGAPNLFGASCAPGDGRGGGERAYRFTVKEQGLLEVNLTASFAPVVSIREGCMIPVGATVNSVERGCSIEESPTVPTRLLADLAPGTYTLLVDSNAEGQSGTFSLTSQFTPGRHAEVHDYD